VVRRGRVWIAAAGCILVAAVVRLPAAEALDLQQEAAAASPTLDSLQARMSRNWATRSLSHYVFAPPPHELVQQAGLVPSPSPFEPYAGMIIRAIALVRLDLFSAYDPDTGDAVQTTLDRIGDALHVNTRGSVISRYFLMHEGERLDPEDLADTERLLRATSFIQEAHILVAPLAAAGDSVDLIVITRDRWTLGVDLKIKSVSSYDVRVADRNFAGWGHEFENQLLVDTEDHRPVGYVGTFRADNIHGSFIRNTYQFRGTRDETSGLFLLSRQRESPRIRTTGAVGANASRLDARPDRPRQSFVDTNLWLGRALPLGRDPRTAFVAAGSMENRDYRTRPDSVTANLNRSFHDRTTLLSSVSLTKSHYREGRLIVGYGQTEDIPDGLLATLTGGVEFGEFETRGYAGSALHLAGGTRFGRWSGDAGVGAFVGEHAWEDGAVQLGAGWFSPLWVAHDFGFRQFVDVRYTYGFRRREDDRLPLDDESGLLWLRDSTLRGRQRLVASLESVTFTPWSAFGFRFAGFGRLNVGTLGPDSGSFFENPYYSTIGFGIRFHNDRLILDPLELRISFSIREPAGANTENFDFGNITTRRFPSLEPGPPAVLPYR
jgi:hypothetical protein